MRVGRRRVARRARARRAVSAAGAVLAGGARHAALACCLPRHVLEGTGRARRAAGSTATAGRPRGAVCTRCVPHVRRIALELASRARVAHACIVGTASGACLACSACVAELARVLAGRRLVLPVCAGIACHVPDSAGKPARSARIALGVPEPKRHSANARELRLAGSARCAAALGAKRAACTHLACGACIAVIARLLAGRCDVGASGAFLAVVCDRTRVVVVTKLARVAGSALAVP